MPQRRATLIRLAARVCLAGAGAAFGFAILSCTDGSAQAADTTADSLVSTATEALDTAVAPVRVDQLAEKTPAPAIRARTPHRPARTVRETIETLAPTTRQIASTLPARLPALSSVTAPITLPVRLPALTPATAPIGDLAQHAAPALPDPASPATFGPVVEAAASSDAPHDTATPGAPAPGTDDPSSAEAAKGSHRASSDARPPQPAPDEPHQTAPTSRTTTTTSLFEGLAVLSRQEPLLRGPPTAVTWQDVVELSGRTPKPVSGPA